MPETSNHNTNRNDEKLLYQDKKHHVQLIEELSSIKQGQQENITQFYQRLEELVGRILSSTKQSCSEANLLPGKIASVDENALNRFLFHCHPQVSYIIH